MKKIAVLLLWSALCLAQAPRVKVSELNGMKYADQFSSIQAAITAAGATGAVTIPAYYAGTDSFTNPNNITVIDHRQGAISLINPRFWGAKMASGIDDTAALNSAISFAETLTQPVTGGASAKIYIPPGRMIVGCSAPVRIQKQGIALTGDGRTTSFLGPDGSVSSCAGLNGLWFGETGPDSSYAGNPMTYNGTALLTGGSNALQNTSNSNTVSYLEVRDCPVCGAMNGLGAFTVEMTYKPTAVSANLMLWTSSGVRDTASTVQQAGYLYVSSSGQINGALNIAGTLKTVNSGATTISAGSAYHIAMSYDGSNIRVFVNGVVSGTTAATGNIQQQLYEAVHIGCDGGASNISGCSNITGNGLALGTSGGFYGVLDGLRISSNARYTSGFGPPSAKFTTADAATLLACPFITQYGPFTTCVTYTGGTQKNVFLVIHRTDFCPGGAQQANVQGIAFTYGGEYFNPGIGVTLSQIGMFGSNGNGIQVEWGCPFNSNYSDLWFTGVGAAQRYAFFVGTGISSFEKISLNGGAYGFIGPSNSVVRDSYFLVDSTSVIPWLIHGVAGNTNTLSIIGVQSDSEVSDSNLVAPLFLDNVDSGTVQGMYLNNSLGPSTSFPAIVVNKTAKNLYVTFLNNIFSTNSSSTAKVHFATPTGNQFPFIQNPIQFIGNKETVNPSTVPWTDASAAIGIDNKIWMLGPTPYTKTYPNDTTTGTYPSLGVKLTSAGKAIITATTDTAGAIGVAMVRDQQVNLSGTNNVGNVDVAFAGQSQLTFDGATTAGHYAQLSSTEGGAFHDAGASRPGANEIVGIISQTTSTLTPASLTCSPILSGGSLADGSYKVAYVLVNIAGGTSTLGSSETTVTISGGGGAGQINCGAIVNALPGARFPDGMAGFIPYISAAGGGSGSETSQTINGTVCTGGIVAFLANGASACGLAGGFKYGSLIVGSAVPGANTAGAWATVDLNLQNE